MNIEFNKVGTANSNGCEVGDIRTASQRYLLYRRLRRAGDIRTASQRYLLYRRLRRAGKLMP
jgi:hypothetical protein